MVSSFTMVSSEHQYTQKPFAEALGDLLRERQASGPLGRISLRPFFAQVDGFQYEYLRKMVMGERPLRPEAIEAMAAVLEVPPDYFREYREWRIGEDMRRHPELVGLIYELVLAEARVLDERKGGPDGDAET
jgi:hypothetical protein